MVFLFFFVFFHKQNQRQPEMTQLQWLTNSDRCTTDKEKNKQNRTENCPGALCFFSFLVPDRTHRRRTASLCRTARHRCSAFFLWERIREKSSSSRSPPLSSSSHKTTHGSHPERRFPFSLFKAEACSLLNSPLFSFSTVAREGGEEGCSQVECVRKAFFTLILFLILNVKVPRISISWFWDHQWIASVEKQ